MKIQNKKTLDILEVSEDRWADMKHSGLSTRYKVIDGNTPKVETVVKPTAKLVPPAPVVTKAPEKRGIRKKADKK